MGPTDSHRAASDPFLDETTEPKVRPVQFDEPSPREGRDSSFADPVETAVDPETWKLSLAKAGSVDPLVIRFPAPLDRALLERAISISGLNGPAIAGRVSISDDERCWEFRPLAAWSAGRFQLVVDTALEDLAGNRIGKPFEVDQFTEIDKTAESEPTRLPFEVR